MSARAAARRVRGRLGAWCGVALISSGCAFNGLNSLPLPGAVGRGPGATIYHVEIANVGTLEANSPVMIDDVVVGSISKLTVQGWHANVEIAVKPDTIVPANVTAAVGQTSLLGSLHLALNTPLGAPPSGRLPAGATIPLSRTYRYPSTEQTLSSVSVVLNAGGLGQLGDLVRSFDSILSGRATDVRELLGRLDTFVGVLDQQRDHLVESLRAVNRLSGTFAAQRDVVTRALTTIPPALDVLVQQRPLMTTAMEKLGKFSDVSHRVVADAGDDLVQDLANLGPALAALADVGPDLDSALALAPTYPLPQTVIDRMVRGDFVNAYLVIDLTNAALRKSLLRGTHWERLGAAAVPLPTDPEYLQFRYGAPAGAPGGWDKPGPVGEPLNLGHPPPWAPPAAGGAPTPRPADGPVPGAIPIGEQPNEGNH